MGDGWRVAERGRRAVPGAARRGRLGLRRTDHRSPPNPHDDRPGAPPAPPPTRRRRHRAPKCGRGAAAQAVANDNGTARGRQRRQRAEQDLLLVRLAADSGARRGELTGLQFDDLEGRVLHLARAVSADTITTPKSGRARTLTLGSTTARLWHTLETDWQARTDEPIGPWVFSPDAAHQRRITAGALGHRFTRLRDHAGVAGRRCTGCATTSPPSSSPAARSSKPKPASATPMPPRRSGSMRMRSPSLTATSPTPSTATSPGSSRSISRRLASPESRPRSDNITRVAPRPGHAWLASKTDQPPPPVAHRSPRFGHVESAARRPCHRGARERRVRSAQDVGWPGRGLLRYRP